MAKDVRYGELTQAIKSAEADIEFASGSLEARIAVLDAAWDELEKLEESIQVITETPDRHKPSLKRTRRMNIPLIGNTKRLRARAFGLLVRYTGHDPHEECRRTQLERARAIHENAAHGHEEAESALYAAIDAHRRATEALTDYKNSGEVVRRHDRDRWRNIAEKAGISADHLRDAFFKIGTHDNCHIFYGGVGSPGGPEHGHLVIDKNDKVTYNRPPLTRHSRDYFTDDESVAEFLLTTEDPDDWGLTRHTVVNDRQMTYALGLNGYSGKYVSFIGHVRWADLRHPKRYKGHVIGTGPLSRVAI